MRLTGIWTRTWERIIRVESDKEKPGRWPGAPGPAIVNKSGSGNPNQPNQSTKRRCAPVPPSQTHTLRRGPQREPTPGRTPSAIPPVRVALCAPLRLPPLPPRHFRAIRGSPPHLPFPPPHASGSTVAALRRPPWPPIPAEVPAVPPLILNWSVPIRFLLIVR